MKRGLYMVVVLVFTLSLTCLSFSQSETQEAGPFKNLKPVLGFEFFSRTISWDGDGEDTYTSKLKSFLFSFDMEFEVREDFFLGLLLGYSFSSYDEMAFRELPFSVQLDVGSISGFLFGGQIKKNFSSQGNFEIGLFG